MRKDILEAKIPKILRSKNSRGPRSAAAGRPKLFSGRSRLLGEVLHGTSPYSGMRIQIMCSPAAECVQQVRIEVDTNMNRMGDPLGVLSALSQDHGSDARLIRYKPRRPQEQ